MLIRTLLLLVNFGCQLCAGPRGVTTKAPSHRILRQSYWSELPILPSPMHENEKESKVTQSMSDSASAVLADRNIIWFRQMLE